MAERADWARMVTSTGGSGSLTLAAVTGYPTFTQAFGSGSTDVYYTLKASGYRESGTATFDGTTLVLSARTPTKTWTTSGGYGTTTPLTLPALEVEVFCALSEDVINTIEADILGKQSLDATLTALAGVATAADKLPYFTGSDTAGVADFTAAGRALVDDADAAAQRTTLGLGTAATMAGPSGTIVGTSDTQTLTGKTISGATNTITNVSLTTGVTGTLPVANGGTGLTALGSALQVMRVNAGGTALEFAAATAGGNVSNSGTPSAGQAAEWTSSTAVQGVAVTGTGSYVKATSPTLVTPALGTPASGTLTNCSGLPVTGTTFTATDKLLGRSTSGAGAGEEITCTAAGRALLDDADAAAQRTTLGLTEVSATASTLYGRGSASGAGALEEITLGTNLSMSGTTLNAAGGGSSNSFETIAVSGQSNVVADSSTDTLTIAAGTNITITTNATTDTVTIAGVASAVASDLNTGTSTTTHVTPDALAGSNFGIRGMIIEIFAPTTNVSTGTFKRVTPVPTPFNGMNLLSCAAYGVTAGSGGDTTIAIKRIRSGVTVDMLTASLTITSGSNASGAGSIDTANDDVATGDRIRIDIIAVGSTPVQGLSIVLNFQLP